MPSLGNKLRDASHKMINHSRQLRKRSEADERIPLSPGHTSASQNSLAYTNNNNEHMRKTSASTASMHHQDQQQQQRRMKKNSAAASTQSLSPTGRPSSISFDNPSLQTVVKIRPGMPHGEPPIQKHSVLKLNIDFDHVPFQSYSQILEEDPWSTSLLKSVVVAILLILCPFLVVLIVFLIVMCCVLPNPRKKLTQGQKKTIRQQFGIACLMTFAKDLILTGAQMQLFGMEQEGGGHSLLWYNNIVYSPVVFMWFLLAGVFPVAVFHFASVKYEFGYDVDKKKDSKSFDQFFMSTKLKDDIAQRMSEQTQFFEEKFQLLASIQTYVEEFKFVKKSSPTFLTVIGILLTVMVSLSRVTVHIVLYLLNETTPNEGALNRITIGISSLNALIVSLLAAPYFIYVILWKMAVLREWKRFNQNERDTQSSLVNDGPQGIAMWWKIRQTLKMFSGLDSNVSLSAIVAKTSLVAVTFVVLSVSSYLIAVTTSGTQNDTQIPVMILDNTLLYGLLLLIGTLTIMADGEKKLSVDLIELKQLNVSYELGLLMNLEQEAIEGEPEVKVKVRVIRGCLMLLQELTNSLRNSDNKHRFFIRFTYIQLLCGTIAFFISTLLAVKHLGM